MKTSNRYLELKERLDLALAQYREADPKKASGRKVRNQLMAKIIDLKNQVETFGRNHQVIKVSGNFWKKTSGEISIYCRFEIYFSSINSEEARTLTEIVIPGLDKKTLEMHELPLGINTLLT